MGKIRRPSPTESIFAKSAEPRIELDPSLAEAHATMADSLASVIGIGRLEREFKPKIDKQNPTSYTHLAYACVI